MSASHTEYLARKKLRSLDGVRFLAITVVVFHHASEGVWWFPASGNGFLGVDAFFVLSGYLITTLLLRERDRTGSIALGAFWARRALRIFPVYYALLGGLALAYGLLRPGAESTRVLFAELPYYLTYTSNWIPAAAFGIAWSLATEEQFYLVWPSVERWLPRFWYVVAAIVLLVSQLVNMGPLRPAFASLGAHYEELQVMQATFTPIVLGVVLAHLLHDPRGFGVMARLLGQRWSALVTLALVVALSNIPGDIAGLPRLAIQLSLMAFVASLVIREDHYLEKPLTFWPIERIGIVSYGIYLFHLFVTMGAEAVLRRSPVRVPGDAFLITMLGSWAIAELSFRYFETPFLKAKTRFAKVEMTR